MKNSELQKTISESYDGLREISEPAVVAAINMVLHGLNEGTLSVASKEKKGWVTHTWIKQAILLYLKRQPVSEFSGGDFNFFDKVPLKKWTGKEGVRVVPQALVRYGAFVESGVILMPSYVNIGSRVGSGTMVDTWATLGSCAQVGKNVHLSGGVGIGGVLEPLQARPVIIEDDVFVGSRCVIVEGVIVCQGAVLGAGCILTSSTKIIDVTKKKVKISKGVIPPNSVAIPGSLEKKFPAGKFGVPCVLIIGQRSARTDLKTSLNEALRVISETEK